MNEPLIYKPERKLLIIAVALIFLLFSAFAGISVIFLPMKFLLVIAVSASALFVSVSLCLLIYWHNLSYELSNGFILIKSGVLFMWEQKQHKTT